MSKQLVAETVEKMISCIGELRQFVAIDQMPEKLQQVRQLLRELDYELTQERSVTEFYKDREERPGTNSTR